MHVVLRVDEQDVESSAFGLIFAIGVLSFRDARPAGATELHLHDDDDCVRGRMVKTSVDAHRDGEVTVDAVNQRGPACRWLDMRRGKGAG